MGFDIASAALWIFPLLLAVVCHEFAHGYVAYRLGDPTAASEGRLTLNPIAHIDPFGTILMPAILVMVGSPYMFGYAKPVPVVWSNLRDPVRDMVYVAAAGPAMNIFLALLSTILLSVLINTGLFTGQIESAGQGFAVAGPLGVMAVRSIQLNVLLAVFNLIPVPPLDGGRVAVGLLPHNAAMSLSQAEPYGMFIVFGLLVTGVLGNILAPVMGLVFSVLNLLI